MAVYTDASYFLIYRQVLTGGARGDGHDVRRRGNAPADGAGHAGGPCDEGAATRCRWSCGRCSTPSEGYDAYVVPAVLVLILQQTLLVGIGTVRGAARRGPASGEADRAPGHRRHHEVDSGSAIARLLGKAFAYFSIYLVHALFYFGVVYRLFGFPQRADALTLFRFVDAVPARRSSSSASPSARCSGPARWRSRRCCSRRCRRSSCPGSPGRRRRCPGWLVTFAKVLPSTSAISGRAASHPDGRGPAATCAPSG